MDDSYHTLLSEEVPDQEQTVIFVAQVLTHILTNTTKSTRESSDDSFSDSDISDIDMASQISLPSSESSYVPSSDDEEVSFTASHLNAFNAAHSCFDRGQCECPQ